MLSKVCKGFTVAAELGLLGPLYLLTSGPTAYLP